MSAISECLGGVHEFVHKDKTYTVSLITQKLKSQFEKRLFGRAKEAAQAMRELMDRPDYLAHLKQLNDDYISGQYAFESPRGIESVKTIQGFTMLCSLLFGCDEQEMLSLVTERPDEVKDLIQLVFQESFPALEPTEGEQEKN